MPKKTIKILIVEDEPIIASDIEMTLDELGYVVVGIAEDAEKAIELIQEEEPDLLLLDINLEGDIDGVMLAQDVNRLYQIPFVFLTSNTDYMTINRVKRTKPAGFIVKPFSQEDLISNIEIALYNKTDFFSEEKAKDFFIKDGNSLVKIKVDKLMFAKAEDNYTRFLTTLDSYLVASTLKRVSTKLDKLPFVRIHRSYIININFIEKIQDGYVYIGQHHLPIGRSYHDQFFEYIRKI